MSEFLFNTNLHKKHKLFMLSLCCVLCVVLFPTHLFAALTSSEVNAYIDVVVDKNKNYHVTEIIEIKAINVRTDILRIIPLKLNNQYVKVSDLSVLDAYQRPISFKSIIQSKKQIIKLTGSNHSSLRASTYILKYTLKQNAYKDNRKGFDEVYYPLISSEWDCSFADVRFSITFPTDFDHANISFLLGTLKKSREFENINWEKKEKTITGEATSPIMAADGLTVHILLPDGYFNNTIPLSLFFTWLTLAFILLLFLITLLLVIKYKNGFKAMPKPILFSPPDQLNPAELGYFIDKRCDDKDITSLIFYWASKGYIHIQEKEGSTLLTKIKDLDVGKSYEKTLFYKLFLTANKEGQVDIEDLKGAFYDSIQGAKEQVVAYIDRQINPFDYAPQIYCNILKFSSLILLLLLFIFANSSYLPVLYACFVGVICIIILGIIIEVMIKVQKIFGDTLENLISFALTGNIIIYIICQIAFTGLFTYTPVINSYVVIGIVLVVTIFLLSRDVFYIYPHAKKLYGEVLGFKAFLTTAEKNRLEALLESNPAYFYTILPYAISLNVTNSWSTKFDALAFEVPEWYTSSTYADNIEYRRMVRFMDLSLVSMNSVLSYTYKKKKRSALKRFRPPFL